MIGQTLSHYRILEKLGEGGMGAVYLAEDTDLGRRVALKLLPEDVVNDPERLERFRREARTVARISHPGVVTLHAVEQHQGVPFIVMEHVEGSTLDRLIPPAGMTMKSFFDVACSVAEALRAAHAQGIVHRDLKPSNIMRTTDGFVKVLDFGLAKFYGGAAETFEDSVTELMTRQGVILGTAPYMSPEQAAGQPVDGRSDIFSFGTVLYQMATGIRPFSGDTAVQTVSAILKDNPTPLARLRQDVPTHLARIVHRCLEKDPADRYQSSAELSTELCRLRDEVVSGSGPVVPGRPPDPDASGPGAETTPAPAGETSPESVGRSPRRLVPWIVGAAVLVGLLAIVGYALSGRSPEEDAATEAPTLAVLPFSNLRDDPETDFLGYALADQVIGSLTYVKNLTVRPSSAVRRYQRGDFDLNEVGKELSVDFVLAGNYLRQGDSMRLTVELVDLAAGSTVWHEPLELPYRNAFEMQDLVSKRLLTRLEVSFSDDERDRMTADVSRNPLAYEFYLRALSNVEAVAGNEQAIQMLEQSLELDPDFAPAWDALGRRTQMMAYWELGGAELANRAREHYLKALSLNPELLAALAHLTTLLTDLGETDRAMEHARRMLEINPNSAEASFAYGYVAQYAGMLEESIAAMDLALRIDPTNPMFRSAGWVYVTDKRYEDAIDAFRLGSPLIALGWDGELAFRRGRIDEAKSKLSQAAAADPDGIMGLWAEGVLASIEGDHERGIEAARKWEEAELADGMGWFFLAGLYCINDRIDKCVSLLDRAVDGGYFGYSHMLECRFLEPARGNPGLDAVLEKARLKHEAFKKKFF